MLQKKRLFEKVWPQLKALFVYSSAHYVETFKHIDFNYQLTEQI